MNKKPTYKELEQRVKELEKEAVERKQAENALRESEEKYRNILKTTTDGFLIADINGKFLEVNAAYCQMSGYSSNELLEMTVKDIEAKKSGKEIKNHIQKGIESGGDYFESIHRRKDGSMFEVEISIAYVENIEGGFFVSFIRDISERKQIEDALREGEEKYRNLFENAPFGIGIADKDGKILAFNDAMLRPGGYSREDIAETKYLTELYYSPEERNKIIATARQQGFINEVEVQFKRKGGHPQFFDDKYSNFRNIVL